MNRGRFCSAINCMDGRVQLAVIRYLRRRFRAPHVDMITEAGPVRMVADPRDRSRRAAIHARLNVSVHQHGSVGIALVAHADCAGNPVADAEQLRQLARGVAHLRRRHPELPVIGLWVTARGRVAEVIREDPQGSLHRHAHSRAASDRTSSGDSARSKTAISSRRPSQLSSPSLRPPKNH